MNEIELREKLIQTLIGESLLKDNLTYYSQTKEKKEGIWIKSTTYTSRPIPVCKTGEEGELILTHEHEIISGYILFPVTDSPLGGIIATHQHHLQYELGGDESAGLSGDANMHYGFELAKRGFLVIAPDALPFGKRFQGERFDQLSRGEEQYANQISNLNGFSYMGRHILDAMRAVDLLNELGFEKVGMIGHSLGGITTAFTAAADKRIQAAVVSCGLTSIDDFNQQEIFHNMALATPGQFRRELVDTYALLGLMKNRYLFISAGIEDNSLPIKGLEKMIKIARQKYGLDKDHLRFEPFRGGHLFPNEQRQKAYDFLEKHLE